MVSVRGECVQDVGIDRQYAAHRALGKARRGIAAHSHLALGIRVFIGALYGLDLVFVGKFLIPAILHQRVHGALARLPGGLGILAVFLRR